MISRVLITGGAGFVGSHLADELLAHGYEVRVLDNLCKQVHGAAAKRPDYLDADVELIIGDVRDSDALARSLKGVDAVFHLAAAVGVGQSMYEIENYTRINGIGTATLLEALAGKPLERLIVASSMSIYGEGLYRSVTGALVDGHERSMEQLKRHRWDLHDGHGQPLRAVPTPETKTAALSSVYAISKFLQERLCLTVGRAYNIPTVGLRFFNIYGTRQALSNPYTGVLAIFASRFLNNKPPLINEDGRQRRDFVSVHDVARACRMAMEAPDAAGQVFNIGSGTHHSVLQIASELARVLGKERLEPEITGRYRMGDIRNCFADISLARKVLGYEPQIALQDGLAELAAWLEGRTAIDGLARACNELETRGLTV
ncbi:MAG: NAD-dependent epimerase/dehydratase family protein [Verrucomicrobiota bacterium]